MNNIEELATAIDQFIYDFDPYSYNDESSGTREDNTEKLRNDLTAGNTLYIISGLNDILLSIKDDSDDPRIEIIDVLIDKIREITYSRVTARIKEVLAILPKRLTLDVSTVSYGENKVKNELWLLLYDEERYFRFDRLCSYEELGEIGRINLHRFCDDLDITYCF